MGPSSAAESSKTRRREFTSVMRDRLFNSNELVQFQIAAGSTISCQTFPYQTFLTQGGFSEVEGFHPKPRTPNLEEGLYLSLGPGIFFIPWPKDTSPPSLPVLGEYYYKHKRPCLRSSTPGGAPDDRQKQIQRQQKDSMLDCCCFQELPPRANPHDRLSTFARARDPDDAVIPSPPPAAPRAH